jgi:hypothetical protein
MFIRFGNLHFSLICVSHIGYLPISNWLKVNVRQEFGAKFGRTMWHEIFLSSALFIN